MGIKPAQPCCKTVGIFCSADDRVSGRFKNIAYELGKRLREKNLAVITGGSNTGLMKDVVDGHAVAPCSAGVHGVMPKVLASYNACHTSIPENNFTWTENLHGRLAVFHERCSIIIVLPGGFGTLHELMDFLVHSQLGIVQVPIIVMNIGGFWNYQLKQFQVMIEQNCLSAKHLEFIKIVDTLEDCLHSIENVFLESGPKNFKYKCV